MHENNQNIFYRLWVYQMERFPLVRFGIVTIVFGLSGIYLSILLRHAQQKPGLGAMLISVFCVFSLLFQLRISDEFKDNEVDTLYRPERPVPRGLISLKELAYVFSILWILQFGFVIIFCSQSFPYTIFIKS